MKTPIKWFVAQLIEAERRKDGYIMGATGQNPQNFKLTSWFLTQYKDRTKYSTAQELKALYWREHAKRVWDCNGLSEGLHKEYTGEDINTKARYNYANWCSEKGAGMIPINKRVPGMAVFWSDSTASKIHHVAYLVEPVDKSNPFGDWYIIEARGVLYGVVRTKLYSRKPNFWGKMDKYFDYDEPKEEPEQEARQTLRRGCEGLEVLELQQALLKLGFVLPRYGADGEFGAETESALNKFKKDKGLSQNGVCEPETWAIIEETLNSEVLNGCVLITGGSVNVRSGASTTYAVRKVVHKGEVYSYSAISEGGWYRIADGWISGKYAHKVEVSES